MDLHMEQMQNGVATQTLSLPQPFECKIKHVPIKRIFDIAFSLLMLTLLMPLFLLLVLAIRLTSRGRAIYPHERVGRGGKVFKCYKFRTMYKDSDSRLNTILSTHPDLQKEWTRSFKLKKDPRVTLIGRLLRKTSLDELPQFWNVLKGDLSIVGPRPVIKEEVELYFGVKAYKILSIRPGITGLWQVSGRSDLSYETRVTLDETYVDSHSIFLDLKLILRTIPRMITSKGAY